MMKLAPPITPPCDHEPIPNKIACAVCPPPLDWREHAACISTDPEAFYPNQYDPGPLTQVLSICASCPVQPYCLEAGWTDQHGIWGGWTYEARRRYRKSNRNITRAMIRALGTTTRRT